MSIGIRYLLEKHGVDFRHLNPNRVAKVVSMSPHMLDDLLLKRGMPRTAFLSVDEMSDVYSAPVVQRIRRAFGVRPLAFFGMYIRLKNHFDGQPVDLLEEYRHARLLMLSRIRDDALRKEFTQESKLLETYIRTLDMRTDPPPQMYIRLHDQLLNLIRTLLASQRIYLKEIRRGGGLPAWRIFRLAQKKEEHLEDLFLKDPELYAQMMEAKRLQDTIDTNIQKAILKDGLVPEKKRLLGAIVTVGKKDRGRLEGLVGSSSSADPKRWHAPEVITYAEQALSVGMRADITIEGKAFRVTKVFPRTQEVELSAIPPKGLSSYGFSIAEELVYEKDGSTTPTSDFVKKRKEETKAYNKLSRVFPDNLEELRRYPADVIADIALDREVTYAALTDDTAKQKPVTRIYSVVEVGGQRVITEGRFAGVVLEDMINRAGRMIEGVAYDYDPKLGRPVPLETHVDGEFKVDLPANREPYATVNPDGKIYLKVPSTHEFATLRQNLKALSKVSGVVAPAKTRNSVFIFDPEEFASVRNVCKSLALSESAMKVVKRHYEDLLKNELAIKNADLNLYSPENLGGFKEEINGRKMDLYVRQRQALAWLDTKGGSGLVALDTGTGKTALAIAYIQNLEATGVKSENERILYVGEAALRDNLPKEARIFLKDPDKWLESIDIISYADFSKAPDNIMDGYTAVIFDEAHKLASLTSERAKRAMRPHPRKLLLTGSPMDDDIASLRILTAIAESEPITTKDVSAFTQRFCEKIGGRSVSVKSDPDTTIALQEWVKQRMFYTHKTDIAEYQLEPLQRETRTLTMPGDIEVEYRDALEGVKGVLEGMVKRYKYLDPEATDPEIGKARIALAGEFKRLSRIANMPSGIRPPKAAAAESIIRENLDRGGRTMMWTDDPEFADVVAKDLSESVPGSVHASCKADEILLWRAGEVVEKFTPKNYKWGQGTYDKKTWRMGVMEHVIKVRKDIVSCTLTSSYTTGFNLQQFNTVIHLDRDSWSAENMKQRTARAWRQGQEGSVVEVTLDTVFPSKVGEFDATLDEIRGMVQDMSEDLFNKVVIDSQRVAVGKEYLEMEQILSSKIVTDRKMAELALSPYAQQVADLGDHTTNLSRSYE